MSETYIIGCWIVLPDQRRESLTETSVRYAGCNGAKKKLHTCML